MISEPAFRTVFDVSERIPIVIAGWISLLLLGVSIVTFAVPSWRAALLRRWWLALVAVVPLYTIVSAQSHMIWPFVWGAAWVMIGAANEVRGKRLRWSPRLGGSVAAPGTTGLIAAAVLLAFALLGGLSQHQAPALLAQLNAGDATVLSGRVQGYVEVSPAGKNDCFSVAERRFCVSDWILDTPGFRQTKFSGTPIADGDLVRLSVIGNAIVRVEVAAPTTTSRLPKTVSLLAVQVAGARDHGARSGS